MFKGATVSNPRAPEGMFVGEMQAVNTSVGVNYPQLAATTALTVGVAYLVVRGIQHALDNKDEKNTSKSDGIRKDADAAQKAADEYRVKAEKFQAKSDSLNAEASKLKEIEQKEKDLEKQRALETAQKNAPTKTS